MKQGLMLLLLICLHSVVYSTPRLSCHDLFSQVIIRSNGVIDFQAEVKRRSQERGSPSKLNSSSQKRGAKVISLLEYKK
ncbi:MAG: hypothetical protein KDD50_15595, partial [Bdellovibrionales bacterium]|nr:hypothetical protein [Bdellovibrionales bacterium]